MLSPSEHLKVELMTHGLTITEEASHVLKGQNGTRPMTLADYASTSGITLEIDSDIWVNAPIKDFNPNFVSQSPFRLEFREDQFFVCSDALEVKAKPIPVPSYYDKTASTGEQYILYAITHTDRVRVSPIEGCSFGCSFCDSSFKYKYRKKSIEGLIEAVRVALQDPVLPARHIMISGGTPYREDFDYLNEVYEKITKAFLSVPLDIMMVPIPGLLEFEFLKDIGVKGLSLNIELFNEDIARKLMPKKSKLSRKAWIDAMDQAVKVFGQGRIRSMLLVGLESLNDTVRGVELLAEHGCEPVLSPFRPDPVTPLYHHSPPGVRFLSEVYERSMEAAARHGMKLGPRCIPCQHNTLTFPDGSDYYFHY